MAEAVNHVPKVAKQLRDSHREKSRPVIPAKSDVAQQLSQSCPTIANISPRSYRQVAPKVKTPPKFGNGWPARAFLWPMLANAGKANDQFRSTLVDVGRGWTMLVEFGHVRAQHGQSWPKATIGRSFPSLSGISTPGATFRQLRGNSGATVGQLWWNFGPRRDCRG